MFEDAFSMRTIEFDLTMSVSAAMDGKDKTVFLDERFKGGGTSMLYSSPLI